MPGTLFLAQTPYHILLSLGLSSPGDTIQIIDDFHGSGLYVDSIRAHYPRLTVPGAFPGRATTEDIILDRIKHSRKNIRTMRGLVDRSLICRLVLFNDRTPETQYAAYLAGRKGIPMEYVEDGLAAYISPEKDAPRIIRGSMAKLLFGRYYHNIITLGTSPYTTTVRAFFPELVISSLQQKEIIPLNDDLFDNIDRNIVDEVTKGINDNIEFLLALPHSEILGLNGKGGDAISLKEKMQAMVAQAANMYGHIAVKYHPREEGEYLGQYTGCDVLPRQTPMELIYLKLKGKELKEVAGPLSTSIYTARIILGDDVTITTVGNVDGPDALRFLKHLRKDAL